MIKQGGDICSSQGFNFSKEVLDIEDIKFVKQDQSGKSKCKVVAVIVAVIVLATVAGLTAWAVVRENGEPAPMKEKDTAVNDIPEIELRRIDCFPETGGGVETVDQAKCEARGCVWHLSEHVNVPACFVPQPENEQQFGYRVINGPEDTELGQRWYLQRINEFAIYDVNVELVTFDVEYRDNHLLRFKFDDTTDSGRFKVPVPLNLGSVRAPAPKYEVQVQENGTFSFKILRRDTGTVLWDTSVGGFAFANQFLQISTRLPSDNIYGMGENLHFSLKHNLDFQTWPLWSRDQPPHSNDENQNLNLYSVHPFYECLEVDGNSHGVLLLNANAMDYTLTPLPMLTYKTIGGILDFYMFMGPAPENVVQQYTQAVGKPYMPPYFMLGFQISRYGYRDTNMIRESVDRTLEYDIPYDVQYVDIDHMYKNRDFTIDAEHFGDLPEYFAELRQMGLKTVIILDPTLEINDTYQPYLDGVEADIFIKWPDRASMPEGDYEEYNSTDMMGTVWPEWKCVFPDFFLNETAALWTKWLVDFRERIPFDALWLDMNEPANFDTNKWRPWNWPEDDPTNWTLKCTNNSWDDPPYRTKAAFLYDDPNQGLLERLSSKTICMTGTHEHAQSLHYNLHSLYGWKQTIVSLDSMREAVLAVEGIEKRSMLVTRSTFTGSGQHAGRWLGDNASSWKDLRLSIIGMLEFNIMGFPYVGADICGFFENCTAELCKRWQEVGAFYPYSRNHNHEDPHHQDPAFYGPEVVNPTKRTLEIRYTLLPHLYTLFHRAHIHGDTVIRPLFHQFPLDNNTWAIERQFLWGAALLFSPILEEGQTELSYYLPRGRWYDWYTNSVTLDTEGEWRSISVDQDTLIQVHIRGGHILPWQSPANNTHYSRKNAFGLKAALDAENGEATGALFWDDGDSIDTFENGNYYAASYQIDSNVLKMNVEHLGSVEGLTELVLDTVQVLGVSQANFVYVNDLQHTDFTFNTETQYLEITNLQLPMVDNFQVEWRESERPLNLLQESERVDCCPEMCDQAGCEAKHCVWTESSIAGVPWCYVNNDVYGYTGSFSSEEGTYTTWKEQSSMFGGDIQQVRITAEEYNYVYRIKLEDHNDPDRYQVPLPLHLQDDGLDDLFNLQLDFVPTFNMRLTRTGDETTALLDTSIGGLTMADQFLQLSTRLASRYVYGFGEHVHPALKHNLDDYNSWAMFARDEPPKGGGANLYSTHPFYMVVEETGRCHGVLFWNSNAMEVVFLPSPGLTLRAVGGIMDIYVIIGDSPEELLQRYHQLIGFPYLPPYWALGFQISRYGYETVDNMRSIVERNVQANIPLDVVYLDIDSLEEHKSFTWDREQFAGLPEYLDYLHSVHIRNIIIIDPFLISNETNYPPYDLGLQRNLFIKWPQDTSPDYDIHNNDNLLGWAWPTGYCVFPDFFHTNSTSYWELLIQNYHTELEFDGLWLDMNEPANFGTNEDKPWNWPDDVLPYWSLKCPHNNSWDNPPYKPVSMLGQWLCDKTICMTALQGDTGDIRHYNVHSLYGHSQTLPTLSGLRKAIPGQRGLVITRSTFPSTGVYGGRWLGDNAAIWPHLKDSIIGMLEFNFFGIPYVGADICGYFDSCPEELCQRWQQLGAFYPYSRNHNGIGYDDQDPGAFSPGMQASTRKALETRYQLLPYLYTLFYVTHTQGGTVARPLFHEFPTDSRSLDVDEQFLWGPALLISPVLDQGVIEVNAYFPAARWFDFYTGSEVSETGRAHIVDAPLDHIPLHLRGGYIIPLQQSANTTFYSRQSLFELLVVPDLQKQAHGDLFWDDGLSVDTVTNNTYCLLHFDFSQNEVNMTVVQRNSPDLDDLDLGRLRVFGVTEAPDRVTSEPASETLTFSHNPDTQVLTVEEIHLNMATEFSITWE